MSLIILEDMEFFAKHGCFDEERIIGTNFLVHLEIDSDTSKAEKSDSLQDTIDYQKVYNTVKKEMDRPSNLLENVANRIIDKLMGNFQTIKKVTVKVSKLNPPLGYKMKSVSVQLTKMK
jgi:7,8-dihydroneopterin aldolase/epimerase/oxygenase